MKCLFADISLNLSVKDSEMKKNKKHERIKRTEKQTIICKNLEITLGTDMRAMCLSAPLDLRNFFWFFVFL